MSEVKLRQVALKAGALLSEYDGDATIHVQSLRSTDTRAVARELEEIFGEPVRFLHWDENADGSAVTALVFGDSDDVDPDYDRKVREIAAAVRRR